MSDARTGDPGPLQVAATAMNVAEAELMRGRLAEDGITALIQRSIGGPEWGGSGSQYVYVEADDLKRAREILEVTEGVSDEELTRLAEESAPPPD